VKNTLVLITVMGFALVFGATAAAQDLIVFPAKGQSQAQMEKDKFECYTWAKQQSGFDPMQASPTASAAPSGQEPQGGVVKGAARGALVGVAVGAIAGDAGKGAAIGAVSGGMIGGMRQRDEKARTQQAKQQQQQEQAAALAAKQSTYNRAYGACLEGKGYTVK